MYTNPPPTHKHTHLASYPSETSHSWHFNKRVSFPFTTTSTILYFCKGEFPQRRDLWLWAGFTWLIAHSGAFVQDDACLNVGQLYLSETKHDARPSTSFSIWLSKRSVPVTSVWVYFLECNGRKGWMLKLLFIYFSSFLSAPALNWRFWLNKASPLLYRHLRLANQGPYTEIEKPPTYLSGFSPFNRPVVFLDCSVDQ